METAGKTECELLLWPFPLMSTLFLFLFSNPTLGSRELRVSILWPGLVKRPHSYSLPDLQGWPTKIPCKKAHAQHNRMLICQKISIYRWWGTARLYSFLAKAGINSCGGTAKEDNEAEETGANWVNGAFSLTGLLEAPDFVHWFVRARFPLSHWETFKHTCKRRSCGERLSAYLFGDWSKCFPLPCSSQP